MNDAHNPGQKRRCRHVPTKPNKRAMRTVFIRSSAWLIRTIETVVSGISMSDVEGGIVRNLWSRGDGLNQAAPPQH